MRCGTPRKAKTSPTGNARVTQVRFAAFTSSLAYAIQMRRDRKDDSREGSTGDSYIVVAYQHALYFPRRTAYRMLFQQTMEHALSSPEFALEVHSCLDPTHHR
jgi:hypothetical protein